MLTEDELHCQYDCALGQKSLLAAVNRYKYVEDCWIGIFTDYVSFEIPN